MRKYTLEENALSLAVAIVFSGLYLIGYILSRPVPVVNFQRHITPIPEEICTEPIHILAEDTYAIEVEISTTQVEQKTSELTAKRGVNKGISGKETWYNLPMNGVISLMRSMGYSKSEYPYEVREDGVKTFGGYVMVAADLDKYPKGTIVETSLGTGIVCDTGDFVNTTDVEFDIATNWEK